MTMTQMKMKRKKESKSTALATASYPGFKGRCFTFGNFGHKSADCPNKKNESENGTNEIAKRFNGRCMQSERWGRKRPDRWYYKKELERQKNNSKNVNVTSETKIDKDIAHIRFVPSGSEIALLCTEICKDVWIADSIWPTHYRECTIDMRYHPK